VAAYDSAIDLTHDTAERQYLRQRRDAARRRDPSLRPIGDT
jgi:predicted RNA polymerase sigma factor